MADSKELARKRKAAQRERERALGISEIGVRLSAAEREKLDELCRVRAGDEQPYSRDEYIKLLILQDNQKLAAELAELKEAGPCQRCGELLPDGCNGLFKGEAVCWFYPSNPRLRLVTLRQPLDLSKWMK